MYEKQVVVDFTATWCPPCRVIAPVFAEFAKKIPDAVFLKVDVDELKVMRYLLNLCLVVIRQLIDICSF